MDLEEVTVYFDQSAWQSFLLSCVVGVVFWGSLYLSCSSSALPLLVMTLDMTCTNRSKQVRATDVWFQRMEETDASLSWRWFVVEAMVWGALGGACAMRNGASQRKKPTMTQMFDSDRCKKSTM